MKSLADICRALNRNGARYLLVGGHAVAAHGYLRATHDVDLVVALDPANARGVISALVELGYRPLVPVDPFEYADPERRIAWQTEKGAVVFQMTTGNPLDLPVDLFIEAPFDFAVEYAAACRVELGPDLEIPVVSLVTLLAMKRKAGRPKDLMDIRELEERGDGFTSL